MKGLVAFDTDALNGQRSHWEAMLSAHPEMFGAVPSQAAQKAAAEFQKAGVRKILELGSGQGRDTIFFAQRGFEVTALDYALSGVGAIRETVQVLDLGHAVKAAQHDVRERFPFNNETFDGCFSHMLFCMALTTAELKRLSAEIRRVLQPGGLQIYTVRHTGDAHYKTGIPRGEDMYETGGFVVHFFSREKIKTLVEGFQILDIEEFEEGSLPRKLFRVTLRKEGESA